LVRVTGERRQIRAFDEAGAGTQAHLIDDGVVTEGKRNSAVVGDATGVSLVAGNAAAVAIRAVVDRQEMTARRDYGSGRDG
jgi:hypothetical protein